MNQEKTMATSDDELRRLAEAWWNELPARMRPATLHDLLVNFAAHVLRLREANPTAVASDERPRCKVGCGDSGVCAFTGVWYCNGFPVHRCFCSPACRDAGRPLNPARTVEYETSTATTVPANAEAPPIDVDRCPNPLQNGVSYCSAACADEGRHIAPPISVPPEARAEAMAGTVDARRDDSHECFGDPCEACGRTFSSESDREAAQDAVGAMFADAVKLALAGPQSSAEPSASTDGAGAGSRVGCCAPKFHCMEVCDDDDNLLFVSGDADCPKHSSIPEVRAPKKDNAPPSTGPAIPEGFRLGEGWRAGRYIFPGGGINSHCDRPGDEYCRSINGFAIADFNRFNDSGLVEEGACAAHAIEMGALVRVETESADERSIAQRIDDLAHDIVARAQKRRMVGELREIERLVAEERDRLAARVADLESKLATAEKDRDAAVLAGVKWMREAAAKMADVMIERAQTKTERRRAELVVRTIRALPLAHGIRCFAPDGGEPIDRQVCHIRESGEGGGCPVGICRLSDMEGSVPGGRTDQARRSGEPAPR